MVVAIAGIIHPGLYRHFSVRGSYTKSDVEMMREIITRRFNNLWPTPNLILLDGGKPQLSALSFIDKIPLISLSKKHETIIIPNQGIYVEIKLPPDSLPLQLLERMRDEAHRFSRRLHHKKRRSIIKE
jgi:excinuclease ABC subunit C